MTNPQLQSLLDKYKSCESYIDHGEIEGIKVRDVSAFSTYFARPDFFRFEWKGDDGFWTVLECKDGTVKRSSSFHQFEPQPISADIINKASGLTGTAISFIYKLLMPDQEGIDFDLANYNEFQEIDRDTVDGGSIWLSADSLNGMNTECWHIDKSSNIILEREAIYSTSEYQAKLNAAAYFKESDPDLAASLKMEAEELKNAGTIYKSRYLIAEFNSMTDELKQEKFGN